MDCRFLILFILFVFSFEASAQLVPFAFVRKLSTGPVDCASGAPAMGDTCIGGGTYAGTFAYGGGIGTKKIMVTRGGCNNSATPTCNGVTDTYQPVWGTFNVTVGAADLNDGLANTNLLATTDAGAAAAKFCYNMTYAGFTDWYLPAQNELDVLYTNMAAIGGLSNTTTGYWSSSEANAFSGFYQKFSDGSKLGNSKTMTAYVRCMRRY